MWKPRFTGSRILAIVGEGEAGMPVAEVCRMHDLSSITYYQCKSKFAGPQVTAPDGRHVAEPNGHVVA